VKLSNFHGWLLSIVTVMLSALSNASGQDLHPCDRPNALPSSFFEVPVGPQGDWKAFISPDLKQSEDPMVPVVVAGAGGMQGPAERRGMRLGCGLLRNRSEKTVIAVQLRWILVRNEDRAAIALNGYTRETVLLEGHTQEIQLSISSVNVRRMDFSIISFAAITEPLTRNGTLSGDYCLYVGVNEVRFSDGSVWNAVRLKS
jgi:hypothetical protein